MITNRLFPSLKPPTTFSAAMKQTYNSSTTQRQNRRSPQQEFSFQAGNHKARPARGWWADSSVPQNVITQGAIRRNKPRLPTLPVAERTSAQHSTLAGRGGGGVLSGHPLPFKGNKGRCQNVPTHTHSPSLSTQRDTLDGTQSTITTGALRCWDPTDPEGARRNATITTCPVQEHMLPIRTNALF